MQFAPQGDVLHPRTAWPSGLLAFRPYRSRNGIAVRPCPRRPSSKAGALSPRAGAGGVEARPPRTGQQGDIVWPHDTGRPGRRSHPSSERWAVAGRAKRVHVTPRPLPCPHQTTRRERAFCACRIGTFPDAINSVLTALNSASIVLSMPTKPAPRGAGSKQMATRKHGNPAEAA